MTIHIPEIDIPKPSQFGEGKWSLNKLNEINVLFGKKGSGKSLLLRQLQDGGITYHYVNPERAGNISYNVNILEKQLTPEGRSASRRSNAIPNYHE